MPDRTLVPQTLPGFDTYIRRAIPYLLELEGVNPRHLRLGMTPAEMTTASGYLDQWWTGIPATPGVYELHSNDATKNKVTRRGVDRIMDEFTPFFGKMLKRMSTLAYTDVDKETLNIPERDAASPRPPIEESPFVGIKAQGAGKVKLQVKIAEDSDRPSMHPDADAIKIKFKIAAPSDPAPSNPNDCPQETRSTKAIFDVETGDDTAGKIIYGFANYVNDTDPSKDGPPSTMFRTMIL